MQIQDPWRRLGGAYFWRLVDQEHNRIIGRELSGCREVLDLGCGYGSLTRYLGQRGFRVIGADPDEATVHQAYLLSPGLPLGTFRVLSGEQLDFSDQRFDAVVLRDTLHHLFGESDLGAAMAHIERVLKPGGLLVILDPQPNWVVKLCRWLSKHRDWEFSAGKALALLNARGWRVSSVRFTEAFALPLSGGYVGHVVLPSWRWLWKLVLWANRVTSAAINSVGLGSLLLWRYLIVAHVPVRSA